jgi:taurine transport system permease protein
MTLGTEDQIFSERTGLARGPEPALAADDDEQSDLAAYRQARRRARLRRLGTGALGLPSVSQTVASFAHYFNRPYPAQGKPLWYDALTSLRRILIGFAAGTAIGVVLGAAMSASRVVRHLIDPVIEILRPLPPLAFIPLFIIWFGIGEMPKEVVIILGVTPIMAVTTVAALDQVPDDLRLCARTLGASHRYTMLHVQIRAALPGIITGMRISMAGAWTSIIAAELIAATTGLGYLIMQAEDYLNTALVFSGIIAIAILGLTLDACLRGLLLLADPSRRRLARRLAEAVGGELDAYLSGADAGRIPGQDLFLDQRGQQYRQVVVGGAVPFRACRCVVPQGGEVAGIDDRCHGLARPGQDADDPAAAEVRIEAQPVQVPYPEEWHLPDPGHSAVRTVECALGYGEQDLPQLGYHARPEFHAAHEGSWGKDVAALACGPLVRFPSRSPTREDPVMHGPVTMPERAGPILAP